MIRGTGVFVKFSDEKYVDSLLHGTFYFSKPRDFANYSGIPSDGVNDADEGAVISKYSSNQYDIETTSDNPKLNKLLLDHFSNNLKVRSKTVNESVNYVRICSLAFISYNNDFYESSDGIFHIKKTVIDGLREISNNRPAVVYEAVSFENAIDSFSKSLKATPHDNLHHISLIRHDLVKYSDTSDRGPDGKIINYAKMTIKDAINVCFYKGLKFSSQKEYRIALSTTDVGNFTITIPIDRKSVHKISSVDALATVTYTYI